MPANPLESWLAYGPSQLNRSQRREACETTLDQTKEHNNTTANFQSTSFTERDSRCSSVSNGAADLVQAEWRATVREIPVQSQPNLASDSP